MFVFVCMWMRVPVFDLNCEVHLSNSVKQDRTHENENMKKETSEAPLVLAMEKRSSLLPRKEINKCLKKVVPDEWRYFA